MPKAPAPARAIRMASSPPGRAGRRAGARGARPRCWTPGRGRSGTAPRTVGPMAPRMISHMTSSIPSEPASRTYSMCGTSAQVVRVGDQPVEERVVELRVDEARAGPLQLVAHAAGAPDVDREVLVVALHRPADRLAQHVAAVAGRRRVLHHVHGQRDDPHRPLVRLAVDQGQRHGQAVVDVELVHEREVELVQDQRLGQVRRQVGVAADDRHRPRARTPRRRA